MDSCNNTWRKYPWGRSPHEFIEDQRERATARHRRFSPGSAGTRLTPGDGPHAPGRAQKSATDSNLFFLFHSTNPSATGLTVPAIFTMLDGQYPSQACAGKPGMDLYQLTHTQESGQWHKSA